MSRCLKINIAFFSNGTLINVQNLYLSGTQVSGDVAGLATLVNVQKVFLSDTQVSGDIASLPQHVAQALHGYP